MRIYSKVACVRCTSHYAAQTKIFLKIWLAELLNLDSYCLVRKRRKRKQFPFFYSSLTMHRINKLETARRKKWSSINLEKLENNVKFFIELVEMTFIESTNNFTTIDAFKMLKCLGGRNSLANKMTYLERSAMSDLEKANLFNIFFSFCLSKIFYSYFCSEWNWES